MASAWQRRYAGWVRHGQRGMPEIPVSLPTLTYLCATPDEQRNGGKPCGYWLEKDVAWRNGTPYCPMCILPVQPVQLFAPCPRCRHEHNISHLTANCNAPGVVAQLAARTLCGECQTRHRRLPKAARQRGATVPVRQVIISFQGSQAAETEDQGEHISLE